MENKINLLKEKELYLYKIEDLILDDEKQKFEITKKFFIKECENYLISIIIKTIRKKLSLTQKQLGELIGKKEITIRKYESGTVNIGESVLFLILKNLKIESLDFIKSDLDFKEDINIYNLINSFFNEVILFKSFEKVNDIVIVFLESEIVDIIFKFIDNFFYNKTSQDEFYILFSEYSKKYQFLSEEEKEKISIDLKNYLDFLNFKYNIK